MSRKNRQNAFASPPAPAPSPWGYVFGGGLCLAGLIVLSVALGNALKSATRGVHTLSAPGTHELDLKNEGLYVGVYPHKGEGPVPVQDFEAMEFSLADELGAYVPLERAPSGAVFRQGNDTGAVLFQFEAPRKGKYAFMARGAAPPRDILIVHESLQQNRADIAAGIMFFLVLAGFGVFVLIKTYRGAVAHAQNTRR